MGTKKKSDSLVTKLSKALGIELPEGDYDSVVRCIVDHIAKQTTTIDSKWYARMSAVTTLLSIAGLTLSRDMTPGKSHPHVSYTLGFKSNPLPVDVLAHAGFEPMCTGTAGTRYSSVITTNGMLYADKQHYTQVYVSFVSLTDLAAGKGEIAYLAMSVPG